MRLGLFLTKGTTFEVDTAHIQLWVPRASERPPRTASTPGSDSASQSSLHSRDSTLSLEGPRRGSAATSTQSASAVQPTLSAKVRKAKEPARTSSERVTLEEGPQPPLLVLFLTAITPQQRTAFDLSTARFSIMTISLEEGIEPLYDRCDCLQNETTCTMVALESKRHCNLPAKRISVEDLSSWDLMRWRTSTHATSHHTSRLPSQNGQPQIFSHLHRVTLYFRDPHSRREFGGFSCRCGRHSYQADLELCLRLNHQGLLGRLRQRHSKEVGHD